MCQLYGFTGANTSPMQAGPCAEACVFTGASLCRQAAAILQEEFPTAQLIYGQTDSLFLKLPEHVTVDEAVTIGRRMAAVVSSELPDPIVCHAAFVVAAARAPSSPLWPRRLDV